MNHLPKTTNTFCCCDKHMTTFQDKYIIVVPCYHIFHRKCFESFPRKFCPLCRVRVTNVLTEDFIKANISIENQLFNQLATDILSLKPFYHYTPISYSQTLSSLPRILARISELMKIKSFEDCYNVNKRILCDLNFKIKLKGAKLEKKQCVFIGNHNSYLDPLVLFHLTKCRFLGSNAVLKGNPMGEKIMKYGPLITFTRGKEKAMDKLIKFVKESNKSMCIFPEGMITHPKTIGKFRSGAFNLGIPVQPIIINYDPVIMGESLNDFVIKLASQKRVDVEVIVLPPFYPPFSEERIERVRKKMAQAGKLLLSRVSNRDIKD